MWNFEYIGVRDAGADADADVDADADAASDAQVLCHPCVYYNLAAPT